MSGVPHRDVVLWSDLLWAVVGCNPYVVVEDIVDHEGATLRDPDKGLVSGVPIQRS